MMQALRQAQGRFHLRGYSHIYAETINPTQTRTGINIRPHESSESVRSGAGALAMGNSLSVAAGSVWRAAVGFPRELDGKKAGAQSPRN